MGFGFMSSQLLLNQQNTQHRNIGNKSPYELLYNTIPDYSALKIFGCACYPLFKPYSSHKLEPITTQCVFIGYPFDYKGYLCLDPQTNTIYTSRHVIFYEATKSSASSYLPPDPSHWFPLSDSSFPHSQSFILGSPLSISSTASPELLPLLLSQLPVTLSFASFLSSSTEPAISTLPISSDISSHVPPSSTLLFLLQISFPQLYPYLFPLILCKPELNLVFLSLKPIFFLL